MGAESAERVKRPGPADRAKQAIDAQPVSEPAVRRMRVGAADDFAEREADAVAARVVGNLLNGGAFGAVSPSGAVSSSAVQRKATGSIGPQGGEVDASVEADIDRTRGGGAALDPQLRRSMEGAFGAADFGRVRIHEGSKSAELNDRLGAQAFTVGSDIYLGSNAPAQSSIDGQHLLAHELTHTLQQGGDAHRTVVRRLAYNKPIKKVTSIDVFAGGSSGLVAQVSDGSKPVIVKADQKNAAEVVAADKLMRGGKFKSGKYAVKAPKSRIATSAEVSELLTKSAQPGVMVSPDPRNFVTGLSGANPTLIADSLTGETMDSTLKGAVTSTKSAGPDGKQVTTYTRDDAMVDDIKKLVKSTSAIKVMAKAMAADTAMGMGDRVMTYWNPENFLFDPKSKKFGFVDNTASNEAGSLTSKTTWSGFGGVGGDSAYQNARNNFNVWASLNFVATLSNDQGAFAAKIVSNFTGLGSDGEPAGYGIIGPFMSQARSKNDKNDVRDELKAVIMANYDKLLAAAQLGAASGRSTVIKSLGNPLALTKGLGNNERLEAVTSLLARRNVLNGQSADAAWTAANVQAHKLLKLPFKPAVPAINTATMPKLG